MHRCHIKKKPQKSHFPPFPHPRLPALCLSPVCIKATPLPLILISCCPRPHPRGLNTPSFPPSILHLYSFSPAYALTVTSSVPELYSIYPCLSRSHFLSLFIIFFLHLCFEICQGEKRITKRRECDFFLTVKRKNNKGTKRKDAGIASRYYSSPVLSRSTWSTELHNVHTHFTMASTCAQNLWKVNNTALGELCFHSSPSVYVVLLCFCIDAGLKHRDKAIVKHCNGRNHISRVNNQNSLSFPHQQRQIPDNKYVLFPSLLWLTVEKKEKPGGGK